MYIGVTFGEHNPLLKHGTDMAPRRILHIVEMILLDFSRLLCRLLVYYEL